MRFLISAVAVLAGSALLMGSDLPATTIGSIALRVLSYDRKLPDRAGSVAVTLAIIYREGNSESEAEKVDVAAALGDASKKFKVSGLPVRVVLVPFSTATKLEADLLREKPVALYVCPGLIDEVDTISKAARRRMALSFAGQESYVKAGLSVGVIRRGSRPVMLINLTESRAEGADLDSAVLAIAEVINK